ncbi:mucoidy inhibitor MuiA family protein [Amycolatopsis samaneae]|uniref:mucoidy inhibitor MuiA family protein n=1 Tax=Amycolatopsis samaneae TaxID=664691 RepID=UPI0036156E89
MPPLSAPITAVTVYPQQARITRRGRVDVADGPRAVFAGLPVTLTADSVRVTGSGPARIVGVDVRTERHTEPADAALRELAERRRAALDVVAAAEDEVTAATVRIELLTGLARRSGGSFAKALASGDAEPGRVAEVTGALGTQLSEAFGEKRARAARLDRLREELAALDRRIGEHTTESEKDSTSVVVELEPTAESGEAELELSYVVHGASWEPGYDIRVGESGVAVASFGLVSQHTGEDWPECALALSTARPATAVAVPEPRPWFLDRAREVRPLAAYGGAAPAAPGGFEMNAASARMPHPVAEAEQGTTAMTYRVTRPVEIPSGAQEHRTALARLEFPAELGYVTAPVLALEASLRATVVNTSEHTLRAGRASVFHGTEFVGSTHVEVWAPGEELELALGVDDRIRVERELVRRTAGKATLSGQRRREAEYRTTITNHGPAEAAITVLDQAPVSRDDAITVRDVRTTPDPAETTQLGEFTWRLRIAPGASSVLTLGYRVDVAKGVEITGWRE